MNITFRKASHLNERDVALYLMFERIAAKTSPLYLTIRDREGVIEELKNEEVFFIVDDGWVIGTTSYKINEEGGYFGGLFILPKFQERGIAREAIEFRLGKMAYCNYLWVVTHPENEKILYLYKSLGFEFEERIEDFENSGQPRIKLSLAR